MARNKYQTWAKWHYHNDIRLPPLETHTQSQSSHFMLQPLGNDNTFLYIITSILIFRLSFSYPVLASFFLSDNCFCQMDYLPIKFGGCKMIQRLQNCSVLKYSEGKPLQIDFFALKIHFLYKCNSSVPRFLWEKFIFIKSYQTRAIVFLDHPWPRYEANL